MLATPGRDRAPSALIDEFLHSRPIVMGDQWGRWLPHLEHVEMPLCLRSDPGVSCVQHLIVVSHPLEDSIGRAASDDVAQAQKDLRAADALTMIYPLCWAAMPAMMKSYIDRVFARASFTKLVAAWLTDSCTASVV
jgi:hypothetical protein